MATAEEDDDWRKGTLELAAMCMAIKCGVKQKSITYFGALESEFGPFGDDIEAFARKWLRLQGHDLDYFRAQEDTDVYIEIWPRRGDNLLLVLLAY